MKLKVVNIYYKLFSAWLKVLYETFPFFHAHLGPK